MAKSALISRYFMVKFCNMKINMKLNDNLNTAVQKSVCVRCSTKACPIPLIAILTTDCFQHLVTDSVLNLQLNSCNQYEGGNQISRSQYYSTSNN